MKPVKTLWRKTSISTSTPSLGGRLSIQSSSSLCGFLAACFCHAALAHIECGGWGNAATENNDSWWRAAHKEKKGLGTRSLTVSLSDEHCHALTWRMAHNHVAPGPIRTEDALARVSLSYMNACRSNMVAAECESTLTTFCHWVDHGLSVINKTQPPWVGSSSFSFFLADGSY